MNAALPRLLSELLLPLLGIIFWHWGFAFILWFVAIDVFTQLALGIFLRNDRWDWLKVLVQCMELILVWLLISLNSVQIWASFVAFFMYSDAGIPQGYLLLPLMIFSEVIRLRTERKTGVKIIPILGQHLARVFVLGILVVLSITGLKEIYLSCIFLALSGIVILSIKPKVIRN